MRVDINVPCNLVPRPTKPVTCAIYSISANFDSNHIENGYQKANPERKSTEPDKSINALLFSTSSDTASDPIVNNETQQETSNDTRAVPKRAAVNRVVLERAAKLRGHQKHCGRDRERQQECTDHNDNEPTRNEPGDPINPSNMSIVDRDDEVDVVPYQSGSIAPADSSERERSVAANASADEINNLKRKVWELEEKLSKSNGRLIAMFDRHLEQVKELQRNVCQKNANIALLKSCQSSVSKSFGQNPLIEVVEEYRPMMKKIRGQLRTEADDFAKEVVTYGSKVIRDW